jgi:signal transduction histidine kinase
VVYERGAASRDAGGIVMSCATPSSSASNAAVEETPPIRSRLTLAFADHELERAYRIDWARRSVPILRVTVTGAVVISSVLVSFFFGLGWRGGGYVEGLGEVPDQAAVGTVLTAATFLAFIIVIGQPRIWPHLQRFTFGCALVWFGVDVPTLVHLALPYASTITLSALIMVYGILRLRFVYASALGWIIVGVHFAASASAHPLAEATSNQLLLNTMLGVMMNLILMLTAYQLESADRAAFWSHRQTARREEALRTAMTELTETESRLLEAEREAAQSRLVAGLLHEINNPASALRSNLHLWERIRERLRIAEARGNRAELERLLDHIQPVGEAVGASARRMTEALDSLEAFVGLDAGSKVRVDVVHGLREAARLVEVQRGVSVRVAAPKSRVELLAHRHRLNQVWLQLLDNAAKAAGDRATRDDASVRARLDVADGWVRVEIEDDGPGLDAATLQSAFQVGFTDSDGRVRLQLGLPLARRVVEEHGGRLELDSAPGAGTIARVLLPAAKGPADSGKSLQPNS